MVAPWSLSLLTLGTLAVGLAGVTTLVRDQRERALLERRSALDMAEHRSARPGNRLEAALVRTETGRLVADRLAGSGLGWRAVDFLALNVAAAAAAFVVADRLLPTLFAVVAAAAALRGCWAYLDRARRRRREAFVAQLPEVARVISNATSAGLSLPAALDMAAAEVNDPARTELARLAQELALGQSIDGALNNLKRRMPSRDVAVLVATLVIQQRGGGDLVTALRDISETLESRKDLAREVRTIMAGSVYTSYLVAVLGVGVLLLVNAVSPGALDAMVTSTIGRVALVVGFGLFAIAQLLIRRIAKVEL